MKNFISIKSISILVVLLTASIHGFSNNGKHVPHPVIQYALVAMSLTDTVPATGKTNDKPIDKPVEEIIKEVPKSRKQQAPVPVTIQVKPIPVIKPKIIKPVIKVLH